MHSEKISYIAEIYASREDFIPCRNLCIPRRFYVLLKFMHRERISYLAEKSCILRRFHTLLKFTHRENIFMPRKKSCTARKGNRVSQEKCLPIGINCILYFDKRKHQRSMEDDIKRNISTASTLIYVNIK